MGFFNLLIYRRPCRVPIVAHRSSVGILVVGSVECLVGNTAEFPIVNIVGLLVRNPVGLPVYYKNYKNLKKSSTDKGHPPKVFPSRMTSECPHGEVVEKIRTKFLP